MKGGGALAAASDRLFALKGNNTLQFWQYVPTAYGSQFTANSAEQNTMSGSSLRSSQFALRIAPNPFAGVATISYSLPEPAACRLGLYDVTGKLVQTLVSGYAKAGVSSLRLQASSLPKGIYLLRLNADGHSTTRKMILE